MNRLIQDLRFAIRQTRRTPGFTATAVMTLALGIGATAAVYLVIQSVLLSPLPYAFPNRLVGLAFTFPHQKPNDEQAGSSADYIRQHDTDFSSMATMNDGMSTVNLSAKGAEPRLVNALGVSQDYFRTLGVTPALGRTFSADEDRAEGPPAVILSNALWRLAFHADPSIIGRAVQVNEGTATVVGVMPADFSATAESAEGMFGRPDIWRPLQLGPGQPGYDGDNYQMIARLRDGVSIAQAQRHLDALVKPFYVQFPAYREWFDETAGPAAVHEFRVWPLRDVTASKARQSILILMGAVATILLLACLNLAGLMIARVLRRQREFGVRSALGATRSQLARLIVCEGVVLAFGGAVLAFFFARIAARILLQSSPLQIPRLHAAPSLFLTASAVLAISLLCTAVFSILPAAWIGLRKDPARGVHGGHLTGKTVSHSRLSRSLLVVQLGLAMVLVSGAAFLMGTFLRLRSLPSGIEPKQLTIFQTALMGTRYKSTRQTVQFVDSVLRNLEHQPGVEDVAAVNGLPLDGGLNIGGYPVERPNLRRTIELRTITPDYFRVVGMRLLAGRGITESDNAQSEPVIVIGASAAKRWWPGRSPIGDSVRIANERNWRIVGVVPDVQMHTLVEAQGFVAYAPMAQESDQVTGIMNGWFRTSFVIRAAAGVPLEKAARTAVNRADHELPVARFATMQSIIDDTTDEPRFLAVLAAGFSAFALLLTGIGIFGLLSYQVAQRTREIGVRMALGADRRSVLGNIVGRGVVLACCGIGWGLAASYVVRPLLRTLLIDAGIPPHSGLPQVAVGNFVAALAAAAVILVVTVIASILPARHAASIEPMQALRTE